MSISPETKAERIEQKYDKKLTPQEAANFLKCSNRTVTNLCNRKAITFENIGTSSRRVPRFEKDDLVKFLEKNPYFMARRGKGRKKAVTA